MLDSLNESRFLVDYTFYQGTFTDPKITFFIIFSKKLLQVTKKAEKRLELLNNETSKILEEISLIDPAFLQKKGKGWSIIQVLSHLNAAESLSLIYMEKKIQAGKKMKRVNAMNKFRMWVTGELLKTALRWRAPRYISNPKGDYSLQEMKSKWNDTRTDIKDFVSQYPEELLDRAVYKHPTTSVIMCTRSGESEKN
jgi:hypothetical protein